LATIMSISIEQELRDRISELEQEIADLKLHVSEKKFHVYHFFWPHNKREIYTGVATSDTPQWREETAFLAAIDSRTVRPSEVNKVAEIKKAIKSGGVGIIRLAVDQSYDEAHGIEFGVIRSHIHTDVSTNKNNGFKLGTLGKLRGNAAIAKGKEIVEAGLAKWEKEAVQATRAKISMTT